MNRIMRNGVRCLPVCHCSAWGRGAACRLVIWGWQSDGRLTVTAIHCSGPRQSGCLHGPTMSKSEFRPIIAQAGWGWTRFGGRRAKPGFPGGRAAELAVPRLSGGPSCKEGRVPLVRVPGEGSFLRLAPGTDRKSGFPRGQVPEVHVPLRYSPFYGIITQYPLWIRHAPLCPYRSSRCAPSCHPAGQSTATGFLLR